MVRVCVCVCVKWKDNLVYISYIRHINPGISYFNHFWSTDKIHSLLFGTIDGAVYKYKTAPFSH